MATVRTRFAPSPTGYLHIGGARTALFNYLFARHQGGALVLRIEDTDRERSTAESIQAILDSLRWLNLDWDEGPFHQSERTELYREHAHRLLAAECAYRCYCTPAELEEMRRLALEQGRKPIYDRRCRRRADRPGDAPFVLRFKAPLAGETVVDDLVKGSVLFQNAEIDDLILVRSDGTPTYNFCAVVDDALMRITHIIRGEDHLANTPRQIQIYLALGYDPPAFAHVPLILGLDRTRLSKRHGATSVTAYRDAGYLPEALNNYLVRLGWSHGDQEIFTRAELIEKFSLEQVGGAAGIFNPEKLEWVNFQHLKQMPTAQLAQVVKPYVAARGWSVPGDDRWLEKMVATLQERAKTVVGLVDLARFYLCEDIELDPKAVAKHLAQANPDALAQLRQALAALPEWTVAEIRAAFEQVRARHQLALGKIAQPVRVALTGGTVSPGIFEVADVLGRQRVLERLDRALPLAGRPSEAAIA
jgi:glutamyl-tRNA synthetase